MSGGRAWIVALAVAGLVGVEARAGVGERPKPGAGLNAVGTAAGVDGAIVSWSLSYARGITLPIDRQLVVQTSFTLPMARPDFGDWRWRGGARINALRGRGLEWPFALELVARGLRNRALRAHGFGTVVTTAPGYYPDRWFVAAELAWDQQWATHVRHSSAYREHVYEGVSDGWYRATGTTVRYGARVGGRPWRRMELWLRAGYEQHGRYDSVIPPFYALLGINFRF